MGRRIDDVAGRVGHDPGRVDLVRGIVIEGASLILSDKLTAEIDIIPDELAHDVVFREKPPVEGIDVEGAAPQGTGEHLSVFRVFRNATSGIRA